MHHAVTLLPFDAKAHLHLLRAWLARPHVARWFPTPDDMLEDAAADSDPDAGRMIIALNEAPAGYISWRRVGRDVLDSLGLRDIPAGSIDLDMFLADPATTGHGIGPIALTMMMETLRRAGPVPLFGMTPHIDNVFAQRAYHRAGFRPHCEYNPPGFGRGLLMVCPALQD